MAMYRYAISLVCLVFKLITCTTTDVTVTTKVGTFIGEKVQVDLDKTTTVHVSRFLGIPYAEPPVGQRRFRPPVAKAPSTTYRIVQEYSSRCFETITLVPGQGSEDCLYLNIFAPDRVTMESLPVMIFIHGGGYVQGSGNDHDAHRLSAYGQTIVVTINYRLSMWGFLSTGDWNSPGNYGLWDQRLAIEWVYDNIGAFGGDNKRITVFGHSVGASSVVFQSLFPGNEGLFQRIIVQSGNAADDRSTMNNPRQATEQLAQIVGCYNSSVASMVECLRSFPAKELNDKVSLRINFSPCVDNVFVTCNPSDIFNLDKDSPSFQPARDVFASFDLMTGITSGEGIFVLGMSRSLNLETVLPNKTFFDTVLVPRMTSSLFTGQMDSRNADRLTQALIEEYTDIAEPNNPLKLRDQFIQMYADARFLGPMHATSSAHAQLTQRGSYMYYLSVKPIYHVYPAPTWFQGANHGDDLLYLFPSKELFARFSEEEKILSGLMLSMWTNFAKTGNPNEPRPLGLRWEPYLENNRRYLELNENITASNLKANLGDDRAYFWNVIVPGIIGAEDKVCNYDFKGTSTALMSMPNAFVVIVASILSFYLLSL